MKEPKNAIIKQMKEEFKMENVELEFEEEAINEIAKIALAKQTGARGLSSICEQLTLDLMFELPDMNDLEKCIITKEMILGNEDAKLIFKNKESVA
jgi:ATP-dependent Clp protease ATP-binding subunit ClpX